MRGAWWSLWVWLMASACVLRGEVLHSASDRPLGNYDMGNPFSIDRCTWYLGAIPLSKVYLVGPELSTVQRGGPVVGLVVESRLTIYPLVYTNCFTISGFRAKDLGPVAPVAQAVAAPAAAAVAGAPPAAVAEPPPAPAKPAVDLSVRSLIGADGARGAGVLRSALEAKGEALAACFGASGSVTYSLMLHKNGTIEDLQLVKDGAAASCVRTILAGTTTEKIVWNTKLEVAIGGTR